MSPEDKNKIFGSVVATALFVVAVNIIAEEIYAPDAPEQPGYAVPGVAEASKEGAAPAEAPPAEALPDFAAMIPAADVMAGQEIAERCVACHDWTKDGPNKIGPNLYGVVGRAKASHPGYEYSAALKEKGGEWSYPDLYNFLRQPPVYVPGTKMSFAGIPREADRLNLMAFLRAQADSPVGP
jgi:cytochrome c